MSKGRKRAVFLRASATLELALLMPVLLAVFILLIYTAVFLYNRTAVCTAAYLGALKGAQMEQEAAAQIKADVERDMNRRLDHKLPFITEVKKEVKVSLTKVQVSVAITQRIPYMGLLRHIGWGDSYEYAVKKSADRWKPAEFIWNIRRLKKKGQEKKT